MKTTEMSKARRKVAHAQLSDSAAAKRYEELCKSIPEHGKRCPQHANLLMAEMWAMAEEVYELKGVCKTLGKPYEAEAIKLCAGETAVHYLRDLYAAFAGNRQKALECAKAPYTVLREFRAERAAKNRAKKRPAAEKKLKAGLKGNGSNQDTVPQEPLQAPSPAATAATMNIDDLWKVFDRVNRAATALGRPNEAEEDMDNNLASTAAQLRDIIDRMNHMQCKVLDEMDANIDHHNYSRVVNDARDCLDRASKALDSTLDNVEGENKCPDVPFYMAYAEVYRAAFIVGEVLRGRDKITPNFDKVTVTGLPPARAKELAVDGPTRIVTGGEPLEIDT
jgi:hypothetical protein